MFKIEVKVAVMVLWSRALAAANLAEDWALVPRIHMGAHNHW